MSSSLFKDFIAGGFGGICLVASGHPLDTIKVLLQTSNQYNGILDCAQKIIRREGVLGLYKGMLAPLLGVAPMYALVFFGYGVGKNLQRKDESDQLNIFQIGLAGALSGVFTTGIITPGERIKCLLQIQDPANPKYKGVGDVIRGVTKEAGVLGLYKGTMATLLRDVPASFAYFSVYEFTKRYFTPAGEDEKALKPLTIMFAGGLAGVANWLVGIPADTLKSRLQTAPDGTYPHGIRSVFKELVAKEGITALYRGLGPVMVRAFPANACCFLGVEVMYKFLNYMGL